MLFAESVVNINGYHPLVREYSARTPVQSTLLLDEAAFIERCRELRVVMLANLQKYVAKEGLINVVRVPPLLYYEVDSVTREPWLAMRTRVGSVSGHEFKALVNGKKYSRVLSVKG